MKTTITKTLLTLLMLVTLNVWTTNAAVTPATAEYLFCDETDLDLGPAPTGTEWRILYSVEPTSTPSSGPTLVGSVVSAADLETGYYYVYTVGDANNPEICESVMTEVPLYKFAPLSIAFNAEDYCVEDGGDQEFSGTVTSTDSYQTFSYQWYTVDSGVETPIANATSSTYKPNVDLDPETTTTYRLKAGYLVNSLRYCSAIDEHTITVTPKPEKPTISVTGSAGEAI